MSQMRFPLVTGHYYHIFNRGVACQSTFRFRYDYENFMNALSYYRFENPPMRLSLFKTLSFERKQELLSELKDKPVYVDIVAYALMPNHFHLLLRQKIDNGITKFTSQLCNSYSRYFNTKYKRVGPIFQGRFKSVLVESNEQLLHLSRYIHLNPVVSAIITIEKLDGYKYSSFQDYINLNDSFVKSKIIMEQFATLLKYREFVHDQVGYAMELEKIKHLTFE